MGETDTTQQPVMLSQNEATGVGALPQLNTYHLEDCSHAIRFCYAIAYGLISR